MGNVNKDKGIRRILIKYFIVYLLFIAWPSQAIEVIANNTVEVTSLKTAQLRRIYSMRQLRWADNSAIVVYVLPSKHLLHKKFSKDVLRIFPYQLDRIWNKLTFSGLGVAPTIIKTQAELLHAVSTTPGAIGYVEKIDNEQEIAIHVIQIAK